MPNEQDQLAPEPRWLALFRRTRAFTHLAARQICIGLALSTATLTVVTLYSLRHTSAGADVRALNLFALVLRLEWLCAFVVGTVLLAIRIASDGFPRFERYYIRPASLVTESPGAPALQVVPRLEQQPLVELPEANSSGWREPRPSR
jgi:hypothetical protein